MEGSIFRTKLGFCEITPTEIILTRKGLIGRFNTLTIGYRVSRLLIIYALIGFVVVFLAYNRYQEGDWLTPIFLAILAIYLLVGSIRSFNHTADLVIPRKDIVRVQLKPGQQGLSRNRFEIEYTKDDQIKKRLVILPGMLRKGKAESERAVAIMKREGLLQ